MSDRYSATGTPLPCVRTVCRGPCEGMGSYPSKDKEVWPRGAKPDELGYVFVKCTSCDGTGKDRTRVTVEEIVRQHLDVDPSDGSILDQDLFNDLGCDDLTLIELVMSLEEQFELQIEDIDIDGWKTTDDIADYIAKRKA